MLNTFPIPQRSRPRGRAYFTHIEENTPNFIQQYTNSMKALDSVNIEDKGEYKWTTIMTSSKEFHGNKDRKNDRLKPHSSLVVGSKYFTSQAKGHSPFLDAVSRGIGVTGS